MSFRACIFEAMTHESPNKDGGVPFFGGWCGEGTQSERMRDETGGGGHYAGMSHEPYQQHQRTEEAWFGNQVCLCVCMLGMLPQCVWVCSTWCFVLSLDTICCKVEDAFTKCIYPTLQVLQTSEHNCSTKNISKGELVWFISCSGRPLKRCR
jgi:hypothetical protein